MDINTLNKTVLTYIVNDKSCVASSTSSLTPDHFLQEYRLFYRMTVWFYKRYKALLTEEAMVSILNKKYPNETDLKISYKGLLDELKQNGTSLNKDMFQFYMENLKDKYHGELIKNSLIKENGIAHLLKEEKYPEAVSALKKVILAVERDSNEEKIVRAHIQDEVREEKTRYEETKKHPELAWGLKTGFGPLDSVTRGMSGGEMLIIAGRHGSGKSVAVLNMGVNAFKKENKNTVLLSLEMPKEQYVHRFLSCYTGLKLEDIELARLQNEQEALYFSQLDEISRKQNKFFIVDRPRCTSLNIEAEVNRVIDEFTPDLLIIDYLGIMQPNERQKSDQEAQARVVEEVRKLARDYKTPIISAVQLNRDKNTKDKTKGTERLSRSDNIGATADVVLQIDETEDELTTNDMIFHVIKCRKGRSQFSFVMYRNFETMTIQDKTNYSLNGNSDEFAGMGLPTISY